MRHRNIGEYPRPSMLAASNEKACPFHSRLRRLAASDLYRRELKLRQPLQSWHQIQQKLTNNPYRSDFFEPSFSSGLIFRSPVPIYIGVTNYRRSYPPCAPKPALST